MVIIFDVICIGAALVDMVAQVGRHPSDDDEVFVSDLTLLSGGAAANTASACGKLGLSTAFVGKIGQEDIFGKKIIDDFPKVCNRINYKGLSELITLPALFLQGKEGIRFQVYCCDEFGRGISK